jgi:hypothetical protein
MTLCCQSSSGCVSHGAECGGNTGRCHCRHCWRCADQASRYFLWESHIQRLLCPMASTFPGPGAAGLFLVGIPEIPGVQDSRPVFAAAQTLHTRRGAGRSRKHGARGASSAASEAEEVQSPERGTHGESPTALLGCKSVAVHCVSCCFGALQISTFLPQTLLPFAFHSICGTAQNSHVASLWIPKPHPSLRSTAVF